MIPKANKIHVVVTPSAEHVGFYVGVAIGPPDTTGKGIARTPARAFAFAVRDYAEAVLRSESPSIDPEYRPQSGDNL